MGEDDIVELLWKSGQVVRSSQTQRPSSDPPLILRGSGSGGGGDGNAPPPPLPPPRLHHQNLFIQEDEMASWLHHPLHQDYFCSELLYSTPATHSQSSVSLAPPPPLPPSATRAEDFMNFLRLRWNIFTGGRAQSGPSMQVGSSATPSSSATDSCLIPATVIGGVSCSFEVPGLARKQKTVAIETVCEIAGRPSSGAETEPIQIQQETETHVADDRRRKEREIQETEEARGSTSRKRSRATEMHNLSERRRREKINEKMKTLQQLIPRCNKSHIASMLDDAIEYMKSLQMQIQMMLMEQHGMMGQHGMMPLMLYSGMQQFMPHMAMRMNRPPFIPFPSTPFPRLAPMAGLGPSYPAPRYPFPNIQTSDPSRVHIPSPQPNPVTNQPQFPAYMNPYSQFVCLLQMQQPLPPLQSQTTTQLSFSQASSSEEPEDQDNKPTS